jgi:hypothetical protein
LLAAALISKNLTFCTIIAFIGFILISISFITTVSSSYVWRVASSICKSSLAPPEKPSWTFETDLAKTHETPKNATDQKPDFGLSDTGGTTPRQAHSCGEQKQKAN